jgi:GNAT superfamily N-acetyltransferase
VIGPSRVSDTATPIALEANVISFFSRMAGTPQGSLDRSPEQIRISSGVPFAIFNWVLRNRFSELDTEERVTSTLRFFQNQGAPFYWGIFPNDQPTNLKGKLSEVGFVAEDAPAMAIDLATLPADTVPPGLRIRPVRTEDEVRVFAETLNAGDFQASTEIARTIPDVLRPSCNPFDREPHLGCFIGYRNGVPVATSARYLSDGVVGIYGVATVSDARRKGIGAAMTVAALADGRAQGYRVGVLIATAMGEPVYRRIGFRELFRLAQYQSPAGESTPS